jgi:tRNA (guanosine-2'-O-)-methyltransferase
MMAVSDARRRKITEAVLGRRRGITVVLEDIHDPHNAAAIVRTCDAFGVQRVICVYEREKAVNPKRVGRTSSSSANKWLDFTVYRSSADCIRALRAAGYRIVVTALAPGAVPLAAIDFTAEPIALVFGNEHQGVSAEMIAAADETLIIPMRVMVQSLNVSVTAAICLYEVLRQREASGKDFALSAEEQQRLTADFLER